jgi:hypothetical protein
MGRKVSQNSTDREPDPAAASAEGARPRRRRIFARRAQPLGERTEPERAIALSAAETERMHEIQLEADRDPEAYAEACATSSR